MANKTLVNATAYDVIGGKTLVAGTSYSVKNGKVLVGGTAYDISFLLPPAVLDLWSGNEIYCITYANGYWVVGGVYYGGGNTKYARIAYATNLDGTWTTKDLWSSNYAGNINSIAYGNGYWVVGGEYRESRNYYARIAYATSLSGTWTTKDLWESNSGSSSNSSYYCWITCLAYANGYWVVVGEFNNNKGYIAYATSPHGSWTVNAFGGSSKSLDCITYANGYWVVGGTYYSTSDGPYYARIFYATSPGGTWTTKDLWEGYRKSYAEVNCITCSNGYWVVGGRYYNSNEGCSICIAYAPSPTDTWTKKDVWSGANSYNQIYGIAYGNGYWVVGGHYYDGSIHRARIAYATSLSGIWTTKDLWGNGSYCELNCLIFANGYWVVGGYDDIRKYSCVAYAGSPQELGESK